MHAEGQVVSRPYNKSMQVGGAQNKHGCNNAHAIEVGS
jgi:hypothetical protein